MTKRKIAVLWTVTGIVLAILLIFPEQCRAGAANGVFLCIQVLIPSLFPFMVLSSYVVKSGIASKVPKCIEVATKVLFNLPKDCFAVILLSVLGGYPVGAKGINELYKEGIISEKQAEQMSLFCVGAGPGFLVTYVGCAMLGSKVIGYILLISQLLSFLLLGILSRINIKEQADNKSVKLEAVSSKGSSIVSAVNEVIKACGYMCALVVIFGAVCEIFVHITNDIPKAEFVTAVIEVTNGIKYLSQKSSILLISAMCGFGGLCVHFQIYALLGEIQISKIKFMLFRILGGCLNALFTVILLRLFPQSTEVFSTVGKSIPAFNKDITGCIFLIICCMIFLISIKTTHIKAKK